VVAVDDFFAPKEDTLFLGFFLPFSSSSLAFFSSSSFCLASSSFCLASSSSFYFFSYSSFSFCSFFESLITLGFLPTAPVPAKVTFF
jgi:hypothetical protein